MVKLVNQPLKTWFSWTSRCFLFTVETPRRKQFAGSGRFANWRCCWRFLNQKGGGVEITNLQSFCEKTRPSLKKNIYQVTFFSTEQSTYWLVPQDSDWQLSVDKSFKGGSKRFYNNQTLLCDSAHNKFLAIVLGYSTWYILDIWDTSRFSNCSW